MSEATLPTTGMTQWHERQKGLSTPVSQQLLHWVKDKRLKTLVHEAVAHNMDLKSTAKRLQAAHILHHAQIAKHLPSIDIKYSGNRNKYATTTVGEQNIQNQHQVGVGVSWELDMWGRIADERKVSEYHYAVEQLDYRFAIDSLVARVIQTWIELASIERSIAIEKERLNTYTQIKKMLLARYQNGIGNIDELSSASSRVSLAKAEIVEQKLLRREAIRKLEVLLGRYPTTNITTPKTLPHITIGTIAIPANVLKNRPDVQVALLQLVSSKHEVDIASKARFPQLNLSADLFKASAILGNLSTQTTQWSLLGDIFTPLYAGGRLQKALEASKESALANLYSLHHTVLEALKECEDLLAQERALTQQIGILSTALKEATNSSHFYKQRYKSGLGTLQTVLIVQEEVMTLKRRINALKTARVSNRINLSLATGMSLQSKKIGP
jgi:NodT family efflux transporter outer membrane factor (OMF) lipoprotein